MYADVLIEYNAKSVDKSFTYLIPNDLKDIIKVGMKVIVPFVNKKIYGFVINIKDIYEDSYELKSIDSIVDPNFVLNDELMDLGKYLQERTLCTKIVAYQTMLPSSMKVKEQKSNYSKYLVYVELNKDIKDIDEYIEKYPRRKRHADILNQLREGKVLKNNFDNACVNELVKEDLIKISKEQIYRINKNNIIENSINLNDDQKNAINKINLNEFKVHLLHGVTGSGKTEVYINLIKSVVKNNRCAIMLVPEISLTAQVVNKFYDRFGNDVAIFHSGLSEGERYDEYLKILRDEVHIVVGTRSAVFMPIKNLGIVIIDEEHSDTYKQDSNPRYSAIDMAEYRCRINNIPLVLGSATPSLESMARALKGVYNYIEMPNRVGNAKLPKISVVDMRNEIKKRNAIFSDALKFKLSTRLEKGEQSILLLNRRGYSTIVSCKNCGYTYKCPHCDITLTYHKTSNNLRCHYCGYTVIKGDVCPECKENSLGEHGLGTEKLELELNKLLPNARIIRMDADTTRNKGAHEDIIKKFGNHEYDILLGTQMISKGLDFPLVTLVGVINADATLNIPDFRSGERTYSLLSQVAGRAGRSDLLGEVIIQTYDPDNYTLKCVCNNNYMDFYNYEMGNRKKLNYPPYYYLTSIKIASKDYELAGKEINKVRNYLEKKLSNNVIILGPTTANVFKINDVYRFQIIVKYKREPNLFNILKELDGLYMLNNKCNIEIDNNPLQV
ncbi:MAG: primosomal protein N' [Bacilli bacterium]|nr:primosomal protein N' [Bacilli bacterium]